METVLAQMAALDPVSILAVVLGVTLVAGLSVPVPASLTMLAAGAVTAVGGLPLWAVMAAGLAGAVAGDLGGMMLGRGAEAALRPWLSRRPRLAARVDQAETALRERGDAAIFLSRWLVAPLGPAVSLAAGAAGTPVARFLVIVLAGRVLWVAITAGLGRGFAGGLAKLGPVLGQVVLALTVLAVVVVAVRVIQSAKPRAGGP